jgi:long-chain fatty acid transport protein
VTDYVSGNWEIKNHPAYYSVALQYRGRQSSYFFSFTTPYVLQNDLAYNLRFSEVDTLVPTRYTREVKVPALFATGVNYRLYKRHNVMMDLQWRAWEDDVENIAGSWDMPSVTKTQNDFMISIGYQRDGSTLFYDPYLERTTFRLGGWMKSWYVKDVYEYGGSIGAGLPMGKKGTTIDLALQGGKRTTGGDGNWEELFFGIRIGLMGVGTWGQSRGR